jgi:DNA-binding transcriptional ArsR family regulator
VAPDVFSALANPVRRQILAALRNGPLPVNELAGRFELSRPAVSEHLQVLRRADLVREEPRGQRRFYHLRPARLAEVSVWLATFEPDGQEGRGLPGDAASEPPGRPP